MLTIYCHSFSFIIARNFEIVTYLNHTWILLLMIILAKQIYKCKLLITSLYNSNPGESERAQINSIHKVDKIKSKPKLGRAVWWVRWVPWVGLKNSKSNIACNSQIHRKHEEYFRWRMRFTSQAILCAMSNTHIQYKQETVHQLHAQTQTLPFFANFNVISIFFEENFIILIPSLWGTYWQNISRQHQPVQRYQPLPIQHYWKQNKFRYYCFAYQVISSRE